MTNHAALASVEEWNALAVAGERMDEEDAGVGESPTLEHA
jgi:hypothetical protein